MLFVPSAFARPRPARRRAPDALDAALAREALAGDRLRASVLAAVLATVLATYAFFYVCFRDVTAVVWHGRIGLDLIAWLYVPAVVFELLVCGLLTHCLRRGHQPPAALSYAVALAETSFPTFALLILSGVMEPMEVLTRTPTHHYYLFILLSTLRLAPALCVFTGAVAAGEYLALTLVFLARGGSAVDEAGLAVLPLHVWKAILYLMAGAGAAFVAAQIRVQIVNALRRLEEGKRVRDVFGKHVSPQVVDQLLCQEVELGGEERHVCVLFLDIRDFTARSGRMKPCEVVNYLNTLFDFMVDSVNRHHGIVNKFLGDGFMAVFGAPVSDGRQSRHAVAAAREILERVAAQNAFAGGEPTRVGIGLHAGPVLAGTVGSVERREYTIIGDTVNLASRIEAVNKQFGSQLLLSEVVWREAGEAAADAEPLGPVAVKGKDEPVPVYRLA